MTAQLILKEVTKRFGGVVANDYVTLELRAGEIVGLIGPNGSGKTTLFNSIVGHHRIDSGRVYLESNDITNCGVKKVARMGILRTFQQTRTYGGLTCLENVSISLPHHQLRPLQLLRRFSAGTTSQALAMLNSVGLANKREELAGNLSFGQRRLLEIAMNLMSQPKILLLDEPTAGINPALVDALIVYLKRVSRELGVSLLIVEHNMRVIMDIAERIYCLNHGRVLADGPPQYIREHPLILDAYLGGAQGRELRGVR